MTNDLEFMTRRNMMFSAQKLDREAYNTSRFKNKLQEFPTN